MIHPSVSELTANPNINRYKLVVATAKTARIITDEYCKQREYAEKLATTKEADKKSVIASCVKREYRDEKAVKTAINGLYSGEFKLIDADGTERYIGKKPEETADSEEAGSEA